MGTAGHQLEAAVRAILDRHPGVEILEAVLLAAVHLDLSSDSRQLAKLLEMEHALILRALTGLVENGWLTVTGRNTRTARMQVASARDPFTEEAKAA